VNDWIRNVANFDGLIDFAELLRGPVVPANDAEEILPAFSCFDGIHPNPAGYEAMGQFIDLRLFKNIGVGRADRDAETSTKCAMAGKEGSQVSTGPRTRTACEPSLTARRGAAQ